MHTDMWLSLTQVVGATVLFAIIHSLFASLAAKQTAARLCGERVRNGFYRVFFIAQSLVTFALLAVYLYSLPTDELYRIDAPFSWLLHAVQVLAILVTVAAAWQVGISRILGLASLAAWLRHDPVPPEPEAQGPALDAVGRSRKAGPFAWSRHPLNFAPVLILWLWPAMNTTLFAFNVVATLYLVIGSFHEESRLRAEYGALYAAYQQSGVPFYLPRTSRGASESVAALCDREEIS